MSFWEWMGFWILVALIGGLAHQIREMKRDVDKLIEGLTPPRWPPNKDGFGSRD
jgi:hypothetical protein